MCRENAFLFILQRIPHEYCIDWNVYELACQNPHVTRQPESTCTLREQSVRDLRLLILIPTMHDEGLIFNSQTV